MTGVPVSDTCPHCKATARAIPYYERAGNALRRSFDGGVHEGELVCDACGGPRGHLGAGGGALPSSGPAAELGAAGRSAALSRASAGALRGFGIASIGLGALFALALGASGLGAVGLVAAAIVAAAGGGVGVLSIRGAGRRLADAKARLQAATEKALLAAATDSKDHALTATEAARALGIGVDEADKALTAMADGSRVSAEIDPDGIIRYEFRELRAALAEAEADKVRVELPAATEAAPAEVEVEAEAAPDAADAEKKGA